MHTPSNLVLGQKVVLARYGSHQEHLTVGYTVTKVSATRITVTNETGLSRSFMIGGKEVGHANDYSPTYISDKSPEQVQAARADLERHIKASNAITAVRVDCRPTYNKGVMQEKVRELEEQLAAARAAVEAL